MFFPKNLFKFPGFLLRHLSLFLVLVLFSYGLFSYTRVGAPEQVFAATSSNLNFQGRLLSSSGNVVPDGYYNLEFKLFNDSSSSGSSEGSCSGDSNCLWTETRDYPGTDDRVRTVNGYFSVNLGSVSSLPDINWDQDLWLSMNVGGNGTSPSWDGEMSPKIKLTAVPFAQAAKNVYSGDTNTSSTNTDNVSIYTGDALGATSDSGSINIDVGTATGIAGTISVGTANTSGITIGYVGVLTDIGGDLTVSGSQFTNNGSTLNTAQSLGDFPAGGVIGTAASTVDVATSFAIAQTTSGQALSLPDPTNTTAGRTVFVLNTGTASFNMHSVTILNGYGQIFIWNGTSWILGASGGSAGTISLQGAYDGGNILTTANARDIDITLANTATDSNFTIDIATGSSGEFKIQANGSDVLQIGSTGQLQLDVQGSSGGILLGGDANLYRSAANTLTTDSSLEVLDGIYIEGGSQGSIVSVQGSTSDPLALSYISGESEPRLKIESGGQISWGDGTNPPDTTLYRNGTNQLAVGGALIVNADDSDGAISLYINGSDNPAIEVGNATDLAYVTDDGNWSDESVAGDSVLRAGEGNLILSARNDTGDILFTTGSTDSAKATLTNAGQLQLSVQGNTGGVQIGGDTLIYRSGANTISLGGNDSLVIPGGDLAVDSGNITSTSTTFNLLQSTVTTLNIGGAATTLNLAGGSGSTGCTIDGSGNLTCSGTISGGTPVTLQAAYTNSSSPATITSADAKDLLFSLADTTTDANFRINIATSSTSELQVEANGTDVLQIGSAGQLQLDVQGNSGGILIGGDAALYRSGTNRISLGTDDSFRATNTQGDILDFQADAGSVWVSNQSTAAADWILGSNVSGDSNQRFILKSNGEMQWGGGSSSTDIVLTRTGAGALELQPTSGNDSNSTFVVQNAAGTNLFQIDTTNNRVYIGNSTADSTGTILVLDTKNTSGDPTGVNGAMYYNSNADKFRCYENGAWANCGTLPSTGFFQDGTDDTLSDSNTDLWDAGTYAHLNIANDQNTILVSVVLYGSTAANDDEYDVFTIHRDVGSNPTCTDTQIGTAFVAYTTNSSAPLGTTATFIDAPATTGDVRYTVCSSTDSVASGGSVDNVIDVISITLQESGS